jgi:hypothetical protein
MKLLLSILFAITCSAGFSQSADPLKTYSNETFSIGYPADWKLDSFKTGWLALLISSPKESEGDRFIENVNLMTQDLSGQGFDLEKYFRVSESQIREHALGLSVFGATRMKAGVPNIIK